MVSEKNLANAVGGKTARACDNCVRKRARWYCAADDAFLCQSCDSSVHSANPLARRHERVRLKTSSSSSSLTKSKSLEKTSEDVEDNVSVASWYTGFTRKARSPRIKKNGKLNCGEEKRSDPLHVVPDEVSDDTSQEENVEQLLYRVPIFDPFISDLCNTNNHFEDGKWNENRSSMLYDDDQFHGLLPSEMDLADFAADVESLLGKGLENDAFHMEGLGLMDMDCKNDETAILGLPEAPALRYFRGINLTDMDCEFSRGGEVKVEEVGNVHDQENGHGLQSTTKPFEFKFDDCSLGVYEEDNKIQPHQSISLRGGEVGEENDENKKGRILLRLDYDGVMNAWDDKRCPWTNGGRPKIESYDQCWPYCMGTCGRVHNYGGIGTMGHAPVVDGGREARVSRYREKRRTRLFSKKIRYEVRKLNAEKRPRMKGRFVKRTSFAASGFPLLNK